MITFAQLTTKIQNFAEYSEANFVANIPNFITTSEERIWYYIQLPLFRKNVLGEFAAGNRYLQLPTDFLVPLSFAVQDAGGTQMYLLNKDVNFLREAFPDQVQGVPRFYALWDENDLIIAPVPAVDYVAELHYSYRPQSITETEGGTSWLGDNASDALFYGAMVEAYTFMKGEQDIKADYDQKFAIAISRLKDLGEARDRKDTYRSGQLRKKPT